MRISTKVSVTVLLAVGLLATNFSVVSATSNEWTSSTLTMTEDDGMKMTDVKHNGNLLIKSIYLAHIRVVYPNGFVVSDNIGSTTAIFPWNVVDNSVSGQTEYVSEFYFVCNPNDWETYSCYRYKQYYTFLDSSSTSARFKITLQAFGNGYGPNDEGMPSYGYPTYYPTWRVDTDMPGGGLGDYIREKKSDGSGWNDLFEENLYQPQTSLGQQWRTHDSAIGWSKSLGIDPTGDGTVTILHYDASELDPTDECINCEATIWDDNQLIYLQDIVVWYKGEKQATSSTCVKGHPCKIQSAWIPNGGW